MAEAAGFGNQGPATDVRNEPVVDPTANVYALVEAAIQRQDDLRQVETTHAHEIARKFRPYVASYREAIQSARKDD